MLTLGKTVLSAAILTASVWNKVRTAQIRTAVKLIVCTIPMVLKLKVFVYQDIVMPVNLVLKLVILVNLERFSVLVPTPNVLMNQFLHLLIATFLLHLPHIQ